MPLISVVVPVYNAGKTIERCVDSISSQSFSDLEIILVNDGSTDDSGRICDALAACDNRIQVFHKENCGVSAARNSGIKLATGEYLLFVDSDDYIPLDFCSKLIEAKKNWGQDTFVWTALQVVSENNTITEQKFHYENEPFSLLTRKDVLKLSMKYLLNSPVNKIYSLKLIHEHHLFMDENICIGEDLLFNLHYLNQAGECKVVVLNDLSYYYVRNGEKSLDHGYRKNYYIIHKGILQILWDYCKEWQVSPEDIPLYYLRYWEYMQSALRNNECQDAKLNWFQKMHANSRILSNPKFQESLTYQRGSMGRGSYLTLRSRCFFLVWLYDKMKKRS